MHVSATKQYKLVLVTGNWSFMAGKLAIDLTSHWPWVTAWGMVLLIFLSEWNWYCIILLH